MADAELVPSIFDLDWFGDLTIYQHPPCMFILWYVTLTGKAAYELISGLIETYTSGGGEEGGDGGEGKEGEGAKDKEGDEGKDAEGGAEEGATEGGAEEGATEGEAEEAPAEEEGAPPPAEEEAPAAEE